jgi:hypothetical protein
MKRCLLLLLLILFMFGCSKNIVLNVDGMPVSNHEYVAKDEKTGISVSYVLARYYKKYEGKEYLVVPEYLNAWDDLKIDSNDTEKLILHVKIVNLKRSKYSVWYDLSFKNYRHSVILYSGQLSRKDLSISLPIEPGIKAEYRLSFVEAKGKEFYEIGYPMLTYKVKGGVDPSTIR